jgi:integrase
LTEKLSDAAVRKAIPPAQGQLFLWDTEVKGFGLRITKAGAKSFILDYRTDGRQRRITLGGYPDWTVQAARAAAKTMKRDVDQGQDPLGDRHALREAPTMHDLWERYRLEKLPKKAERSQLDETSMWQKIILPRLGKLRVADVNYTDLEDLHRDITRLRNTPVRANRVIEVLRGAFNLAIRWHWRQDNPARGIQKNPEEKRERYLSKPEIMSLAQALDEHHEVTSANAIKLLMLTGARRGEVLKASWDMFDLDNGVWSKPSAHTKQRRIHRVPQRTSGRASTLDTLGIGW